MRERLHDASAIHANPRYMRGSSEYNGPSIRGPHGIECRSGCEPARNAAAGFQQPDAPVVTSTDRCDAPAIARNMAERPWAGLAHKPDLVSLPVQPFELPQPDSRTVQQYTDADTGHDSGIGQ